MVVKFGFPRLGDWEHGGRERDVCVWMGDGKRLWKPKAFELNNRERDCEPRTRSWTVGNGNIGVSGAGG